MTTDIPLEIILIPDLGGKPFEPNSFIFTHNTRAYRARSRVLSVTSIESIVPLGLRIVGGLIHGLLQRTSSIWSYSYSKNQLIETLESNTEWYSRIHCRLTITSEGHATSQPLPKRSPEASVNEYMEAYMKSWAEVPPYHQI